MIDLIVLPLLKIVFVLTGVLITVMYLVLLERKVQAWVQVRLGPMRVGPHGVLQPIADVLKLFLKEDITPVRADKWVYTLAPIIVLVPALIAFAVIPFGTESRIFGKPVPLYIADLNVGLLYIVAVASIGVYGIILGGWASNSEVPAARQPPLLGAADQLRAGGDADLRQRHPDVRQPEHGADRRGPEGQRASGSSSSSRCRCFIYCIGGLAETNRSPFDLPEAESELVAGFHTEYSGMRFALFFLAEYTNMIVVSAIATTLFFGGWLRPFPNVEALVVPRLRAGLDLVRAEDVRLPLRVPVDSGDAAAVPLRPADAPRLEGPDPAGHRQHRRRGGREGGADALRSGQKLWAKQSLSTHWPR